MFPRDLSAAAGLMLLGAARLAGASPVANLHIPDTQTTFAFNLPPGTNDIDFYLVAPARYSYVAVGFGAQMANTLMLVAYAAADGEHVVVSPRLGTGHTEPGYYPVSVFLNGNSTVAAGYLIASGTCSGCRAWAGGALNSATTAQPMIWALGPTGVALASNDVTAGIKRHTAYGHFAINTIQATGYGGTGALTSVDNSLSTGAFAVGPVVINNDANGRELAHGVVMAVAALLLAPADVVVSAVARLPLLVRALTSALLFAASVVGFALGVQMSAQYIATQHFNTPHQGLGFAIFFLMLLVLGLGLAGQVGQALAERHRPEHAHAEERSGGILVLAHAWGMRLIWLLLLIDCGLGLQLADVQRNYVIGYAVLAGGLVAIVAAVAACAACAPRFRGRRDRMSGGSGGSSSRRKVQARKASQESRESEPAAQLPQVEEEEEEDHVHGRR